MSLTILILTFVTLQRLGELWLSNRNTHRLFRQGAYEVAASHYPLIVALHALWLASLWWFAPGQPVNVAMLLLFALLQLGRIWVICTLGPRWTTRIIILTGAPLVRSGPYRFLSHPNYAVVIGEIAVLPLTFGLWAVALIFSLLNLVVLWIRIRAENKALLSS